MTIDILGASVLSAAAGPLAVSFGGIFQGLLLILFVISALMLIAVILLQEGKGGGLAGAFGGAAAETFGVKAGTVNRFTAILTTAFVGLALLHAGVASRRGLSVIPDEPRPIHVPSVDTPPPPAMDGATPPAAPPTEPPTAPPPEPPPATPPAMDDSPPAPPAMDGGG